MVFHNMSGDDSLWFFGVASAIGIKLLGWRALLVKPQNIGAPDCCVIGQPFHAPPRNFGDNMPVKFQSVVGGVKVDWNAVWLL